MLDQPQRRTTMPPIEPVKGIKDTSEKLRKLLRFLEREKYVDEGVYEVGPRDAAADLANHWRRHLRASLAKVSALSSGDLNEIDAKFRDLRGLSSRTVVRYRYDDAIKAILQSFDSLVKQLESRGPSSPTLVEASPKFFSPPEIVLRPGPIARRVYISMPSDSGLSDRDNELKWRIVQEIANRGYEPQVFVGPSGGRGLPAGKPWTFAGVDQVMQRCWGAALIGLPKWRVVSSDGAISLATEYCQYEGAVAHTYGLPTLAIAHQSIALRGVFSPQGYEMITMPQDADTAGSTQDIFRELF
jgi:hypothetical protein